MNVTIEPCEGVRITVSPEIAMKILKQLLVRVELPDEQVIYRDNSRSEQRIPVAPVRQCLCPGDALM